jgi:CRISPR-associated protein Cas1
MPKLKTRSIVIDDHSYLGMEKGCFVKRRKDGSTERYPLFENIIGQINLQTGSAVSVGALASAAFWGVEMMVFTARGRPVAVLRGLDDDENAATRMRQYEAAKGGEKWLSIAKAFVAAKIESRNGLLNSCGLETIDIGDNLKEIEFTTLEKTRFMLNGAEGRFDQRYFEQVFTLFPEWMRPEGGRRTFRAYAGLNNLLNLAYEMFAWKIHVALLNAKLDPFVGFLHTNTQTGQASLRCDFLELYRALADGFVIRYCRNISKKDFITKSEVVALNKAGKRQYLCDAKTGDFMAQLDALFRTKVDVPRIRHGQRQTIETLISEEALILAKYLRGEQDEWHPRIGVV